MRKKIFAFILSGSLLFQAAGLTALAAEIPGNMPEILAEADVAEKMESMSVAEKIVAEEEAAAEPESAANTEEGTAAGEETAAEEETTEPMRETEPQTEERLEESTASEAEPDSEETDMELSEAEEETETVENVTEESTEEAVEKETGNVEAAEERIVVERPHPETYEIWEELEPGVYERSIVQNDEIGIASAAAEELPKLNGPSNVRWSTDTPGSICWDAEDGAEGCYYVNFYKDGKSFYSMLTHNWRGDSLSFEFNYRIMESGTYTFEICSVGREGVSADSDYIVCPEEFVYHRPNAELGVSDRLWWDSQMRTKACWEAVEDADAYEVNLLWNDHNISSHSFATALITSFDCADFLTESGKYQFTVQAFSADITKVANGQISGKSPVYNTASTEDTVKDALDDALEKVSEDPDAALAAVKEVGRTDLAVAMQTNEEALDKVRQLENEYAAAKGISTSTEVSDEVAAVLDASRISLTGVALNAPEGVTEMTMNFTVPDEGTGIIVKDWQYTNTIQFNIDLNGEAYTDELEVPIRITVPVPEGLPEDRLEVLHYHRDGSYELVTLNRNGDGTVSFTVTSLSPFVFGEIPVPVESISISPENVTLQHVGDQAKLQTLVLPQNASWGVVFASSDENVAQVDANGVVTAAGKGRAIVSAVSEDGSVTASCQIIVLSETGEEKTGDFWVEEIEPLTYTGAKLCPEVKVYDGTVLLQAGKDYKLTYKNNVNVYEGTENKKCPQVVVNGLGNYTGSATVYFSIVPADIADMRADDIVIAGTANSKKVQKPVPTVYNGSKKLKNKTDFSLSYPDSREGAYIRPGTYAIEITGLKNYSGTKTVYLTITEQKLISKASVGKIAAQPYRDGEPVEPQLVVKYGGKPLTVNEDYEVVYENQYLPGKATAVITGIGDYAGTKTVTYTISGTPINKNAAVEGFVNSAPYTGEEIEQDNVVLKVKGTELEKGQDYEVSYLKNINAGTAAVIFTGINGYTGTLKKTFKITPYTGTLSISCDELVPYAKGGAKPRITVTADGRVLTPDIDYSVKYAKNTSVTKGSALPTITVTGKGNYKNAKGTAYFRVESQSLGSLNISVPDVAFSKTPGKVKGVPVITDLNGQKLKAGTDYDKTLVYTYAEDTEVLDKAGKPVSRKAGDQMDAKKDIPQAGTVLRVEVSGIKNYSGSIAAEYTVRKQSFGSAKVTVKAQVYSGKEIYLDGDDLTVKIGREQLVLGEDFEIVESSYKNNVSKGSAAVTIRGINNYAGNKSIKFTIKSRSIFWWWL